MPKKHRHNKKTRGGGFFDGFSNWVSNTWNKTKNAASSFTSSSSYPSYGRQNTSQYGSPTTSYQQYGSPTTSYQQYGSPNTSYQQYGTQNSMYGNNQYGNNQYRPYGGKKRRTRKMRGGYRDNSPTTGLVTEAAPYSGPTAQPHNWVGGKSRRMHRSKNMKTQRRH